MGFFLRQNDKIINELSFHYKSPSPDCSGKPGRLESSGCWLVQATKGSWQ